MSAIYLNQFTEKYFKLKYMSVLNCVETMTLEMHFLVLVLIPWVPEDIFFSSIITSGHRSCESHFYAI